ncbi:hypothetical protein ABW636_01075 [Aquimarina sp. 2201CG1-2-11]|uniref:hypothetical protein n=1 Tax=Aquimarina discodermiae TaxID=3231043 RepID=UPI003462B174
MKTLVTIATSVAMILFVQILNAQDDDMSVKIEQLKQQKERIVVSEKSALKKEVETINNQLANAEITKEEAQQLKEAAAKKHALNIENGIAIIENRIALLQRNGTEIIGTEDREIDVLGDDFKIYKEVEEQIKYDIRTTTDFVLAFGLNNVIVDGQSLSDSDYEIWGSKFFEIGVSWRTRVFKNTNCLRVKYGVSYMSNGLKPTDNRYFVRNGDQTELEEFRLELDKSKFRTDNLVVPVYLEFGPSNVEKTEKSIRFYRGNNFRIGLGGYAGVNLSARQKLKYEENGGDVKDKIKGKYRTNDLVYGLSGYIGFGDLTIYTKYDMSPIFKDAIVDQNNVSLGLRFDW